MPEWLSVPDVIALHDEAVAEYGGLGGLRDRPMLESAVARPQNLTAYAADPSIFELAASYCAGIAKNPPFVDGNKRAAYQAAVVFLELNGYLATPPQVEIVEMMVRLAEGKAAERDIAEWLSRNSSPI
ncbi:MAG: type II toxin-antitoxin system death-on-curing family toxin [Deltaproteobacteria bacterium]|nr:type II toxin-antitoxin system death-on-curing family toxin [Deltaproteobacteria bacterium]